MDFTAEEYCEMLIIYGECGRNSAVAAEEYANRFPNRRHPKYGVFLRLVNRARNTGSLVPSYKGVAGRPRTTRTPANEEATILAIQEEPTDSVRNVARNLNISKSSVHRILKENRLHAYHYTRVQNLMPQDYQNRMDFCNWILQQEQRDPNFLLKVLFTDESLFSREGIFNTHNCHIWADENPHCFRPRNFQHRFSVNLWAGLLGNHLVRFAFTTWVCHL